MLVTSFLVHGFQVKSWTPSDSWKTLKITRTKLPITRMVILQTNNPSIIIDHGSQNECQVEIFETRFMICIVQGIGFTVVIKH